MSASVIADACASGNRFSRVATEKSADSRAAAGSSVSDRIGDTARLLRIMATCHGEMPAAFADLPLLATEAARRLRDNLRDVEQERFQTFVDAVAEELDDLAGPRVKPLAPWRLRDGFLSASERLSGVSDSIRRLEQVARLGPVVGATRSGRRAAA